MIDLRCMVFRSRRSLRSRAITRLLAPPMSIAGESHGLFPSCQAGGGVDPGSSSRIFVQVLAGNIVLRHLMGMNFLLIGIIGGFDPSHNVGLERVSFLNQFLDALRIRSFAAG